MAEFTKSLKGQLLLDSGLLTGSFFHRTVVLLCQHDAEGAFGLVLNRSSGNKVGDALEADLSDRLKDQTLYMGGPVQPTALSYLHSDSFLPDANVMSNVSLGHSVDALMELGESYSPSQHIRLFAGYSGWGAGQLEDELKRDAWITCAASMDIIFHPDPRDLWREVLRQMKNPRYRLLAESPDDLSWN